MSNSSEITKMLTCPLGKNEVSLLYLGYSGVIIRTEQRVIIIDPANLLKSDEIESLNNIDLILFTHSHGDHFNSDATVKIFKVTHSPILAESTVANNLKGKIPTDHLVESKPRKSYQFGEIVVETIKGIHPGLINLYHIKINETKIFHGVDSGYVNVKDYPSNLAFLPTGNPSPTASPENAFNMVLELKPVVVVTVHGSIEQNKKFQELMSDKRPETAVIIAEPYTTEKINLKNIQ